MNSLNVLTVLNELDSWLAIMLLLAAVAMGAANTFSLNHYGGEISNIPE